MITPKRSALITLDTTASVFREISRLIEKHTTDVSAGGDPDAHIVATEVCLSSMEASVATLFRLLDLDDKLAADAVNAVNSAVEEFLDAVLEAALIAESAKQPGDAEK